MKKFRQFNIDIVSSTLKIEEKDSIEEFLRILNTFEKTEIIYNINTIFTLPTSERFTSLMITCQHGWFKCASLLIEMKAEVDLMTINNTTALLHCCLFNIENSDLSCIRLLIDNAANVNHIGSDNDTPLKCACRFNNINLATFLLERNSDINLGGNLNQTPSMVCCQYGSNDALKLLIEYKADLSLADFAGNTSLLYCCMYYKFDSLKILLKYRDESIDGAGIDINSFNSSSWTGLMHACYSGHVNIIELLLSSQANTSITDIQHNTVLNMSCRYGKFESMMSLLKFRDESIDGAGIDINSVNSHGYTALMWACHSGYSDIIRELLSYKADANIVDSIGKTALIITCINEKYESLKILLKHRDEFVGESSIDINAVNIYDGTTALMHACKCGYVNIIELLLTSKADVNIVDKEGNTALVLCCNSNKYDSLNLIIKYRNNSIDGAGIDINSVDNNNGMTVLMRACQMGFRDIVMLLLSSNADINIIDKKGNTAQSLSKTKHIERLIIEAQTEQYILK